MNSSSLCTIIEKALQTYTIPAVTCVCRWVPSTDGQSDHRTSRTFVTPSCSQIVVRGFEDRYPAKRIVPPYNLAIPLENNTIVGLTSVCIQRKRNVQSRKGHGSMKSHCFANRLLSWCLFLLKSSQRKAKGEGVVRNSHRMSAENDVSNNTETLTIY